jgi:hypothetical protein
VERFFVVDFFAVDLPRDLLDECFTDELFDRDDFALADRDFFVETLVQRTRVRLLRALRARIALVQRTGFGRVQPASSSARNAVGIASTGVGPSITARTAASLRSERMSAMIFAGRCALAACTRFVSSTTNISRSGSIQIDVPVKPV